MTLQDISDKNAKQPKLKTSGKLVMFLGLILVALLFIGGGAWATFSTLSGAVVAQGQIVVLGEPKTIQHLDGGIIAEININNGDEVSKDEVLIRLDDTLLKANLNITHNRLIEAIALRARLNSERDNLEDIIWFDEVLNTFDIKIPDKTKNGQEKLFDARKFTRFGQISQMDEQINQLKSQLVGVNALKDSRGSQLKFLKEELRGIRKLHKQGLSPKSKLMALERQRAEITGQIAEHDSEYSRIQNQVSEAEIQILQVSREFNQTVLTELREVEKEINELIEQYHATSEQLQRIEIKSPVAGIVHELNIFTIGGVITPSNPIMQIIPQNGGYEIEVNVEPQYVDDIYPNQEARLRFSAFNQRTTPELNGTVKDISANVVTNEQTGVSYYKVRLTVSLDELKKLKDQQIVPGMPVETFIQTRERTALNYFTKPLMDQVNRAFKEE